MATSARRLRIPNPVLSQSEVSFLTADYSSGTGLTVANSSGLAANDILVVGVPFSEKTEAQAIDSIGSATAITLSSALSFTHPSGTPVSKSEYDQVEITKNSGSGWSSLTTTDLQWDKDETIYIDQGGTDNDSYRYRFYNSASGNYSEYSQTVSGGGYNKSQLGFRIDKIRKEINDPDRQLVTDDRLIALYDEAKDIVKSMRNDWYFWTKEDQGTIETEDGVRKYNLDTISDNIEYLKDLRFYDSSNSTEELYPLRFVSRLEMDSLLVNQTTPDEDDTLTKYTIAPPDSNSSSGYIVVYPLPETDSGGSFYPRYYQPDGTYDDLSDTIGISIPSVLDHYVLSYCYKLKGDDARAGIEEDMFFGPTDFRKRTQRPTGIALLERMQVSKGKPTDLPKSVKVFKGRTYYQKVTGTPRSSWDDYKEKYF